MKKNLVGLVGLIVIAGCSGTMPELGLNNGELMPCPKTPNCVNSRAVDETHSIEPLRYTGTISEAKSCLVQTVTSEMRTKILVNQENYMRTEFTSALFRFVDDVEFHFTKGQDGKTVIHIRSASRIGRSDLGANRKRIERIRGKFSPKGN